MKIASKPQLGDLNLRTIVETEIERLLAILDSVDGDPDMEPSLAGYSDGMDDREGDEAESGVADLDGYMEQYQHYN